jgi:hypothetical protein
MFDEIKSSLAEFGVTFDLYFNEKDLHDRGELDSALNRLREDRARLRRDGATWLRTTDFGDDRDRVLVRATVRWTLLRLPTARTTGQAQPRLRPWFSCSAPTTTATSVGCGPWPPASATTGQTLEDPHRTDGQPGPRRQPCG